MLSFVDVDEWFYYEIFCSYLCWWIVGECAANICEDKTVLEIHQMWR